MSDEKKETVSIKPTGKHKVVTPGQFLQELRKDNQEARWEQAVAYIYDTYTVVNTLMHKGGENFVVEVK